MRPALSQICTLDAPFQSDIADYAAAKCQSIEIWLGKLETFLQSHSTQAVRRLLEEHGVQAPVASFQGGLAAGSADSRAQHWQHLARRLELCRELGIGTLVVAADFAEPVSRNELDRFAQLLSQAARQAGEQGVRLALEFQARAAFCNNLQTAAALVDEIASPYLGLCFDVFHYFTGPSKPEDLAHLTTENLLHVQLCDVADKPRELARDADRILPGDGNFPLAPIVEQLRRMDYTGCVSLELMNPHIWQIAPLSFAEIGMTALRHVLGQASMMIWTAVFIIWLLFSPAAHAERPPERGPAGRFPPPRSGQQDHQLARQHHNRHHHHTHARKFHSSHIVVPPCSWPYVWGYGSGFPYAGFSPLPFGYYVDPLWGFDPVVVVPAEPLFGPLAVQRFMTGAPRVLPAPAGRRAPEARQPDGEAREKNPPPANARARARATRLIEIGDAHFRDKKYHVARERYKDAALAVARFAEPHFRQGHALVAMRQYHRAIQAYRRGLDIKPDWARSGFHWDDLYQADPESKTGHRFGLIQAAAASPQDGELMFLLGVHFHFDGQKDRAHFFFSQALERLVNAQYVQAFLADLPAPEPHADPAKAEPPLPPPGPIAQ